MSLLHTNPPEVPSEIKRLRILDLIRAAIWERYLNSMRIKPSDEFDSTFQQQLKAQGQLTAATKVFGLELGIDNRRFTNGITRYTRSGSLITLDMLYSGGLFGIGTVPSDNFDNLGIRKVLLAPVLRHGSLVIPGMTVDWGVDLSKVLCPSSLSWNIFDKQISGFLQ